MKRKTSYTESVADVQRRLENCGCGQEWKFNEGLIPDDAEWENFLKQGIASGQAHARKGNEQSNGIGVAGKYGKLLFQLA